MAICWHYKIRVWVHFFLLPVVCRPQRRGIAEPSVVGAAGASSGGFASGGGGSEAVCKISAAGHSE